MLLVLSPAKSLDYETPTTTNDHSIPEFIDDAIILINQLKKLSLKDLAVLMSLSDKLAALNVARYAEWSKKNTLTHLE